MTKRIVTKIGDVFCVEIENQHKRFFQYIVSDMTMLNSSVIRVFKRHYPMDYVPDTDEIIKDEVEFYAHTVLRAGIMYNAWYKVGKAKELGDFSHVIFRCDMDIDKVERSVNWVVWHINEPMIHVRELPEKYYSAELGSVKPYVDIVNRLKFGKYLYYTPKY